MDHEPLVMEQRDLLKKAIQQHKSVAFFSELLLGVAPHTFNASPESILTLAIKYKRPDLVLPLLEAKADPNFVDETNVPVLNRALDPKYIEQNLAQDYKSAIHHLIEHNALPNSVDRHGDTPLLMAVNAEEEEVVKLLIAKGADPFQPCKVTRLKDARTVTISPYERAIEKLNDSERTTYPRMIALKNIIKFIDENHWPIEKRIAFLRIFHPSRAHPPQDRLPSHVMIPKEVVCYGLYKAITNSHLIRGRPKEPPQPI
jgi:hypothetical protein